MCLNCGCGEIDERHGVDANITAQDVRRAASSNGQDLRQTVANIEASLKRIGDGAYAAIGIGTDARTPDAGTSEVRRSAR